MSLLNVLEKIFTSVARSTAQRRADFSRQYEREHLNMSSSQRDKFEEFNRMTEKFADAGNVSVIQSLRRATNSQKINVSKEDFNEWDTKWQYIGFFNDLDLHSISHCVGVYRLERLGHVVYIGSATQLTNGGIKKMLERHRNKTDNPTSNADKLISEHLDEIEVYVLVVGNTSDAIDKTRILKGMFINHYRPLWNK